VLKLAEDLFVVEVIRLGESCCRGQSNEMTDTSGDLLICASLKMRLQTLHAQLKHFSFWSISWANTHLVDRLFVKCMFHHQPHAQTFYPTALTITSRRNKLSAKLTETLFFW